MKKLVEFLNKRPIILKAMEAFGWLLIGFGVGFVIGEGINFLLG